MQFFSVLRFRINLEEQFDNYVFSACFGVSIVNMYQLNYLRNSFICSQFNCVIHCIIFSKFHVISTVMPVCETENRNLQKEGKYERGVITYIYFLDTVIWLNISSFTIGELSRNSK